MTPPEADGVSPKAVKSSRIKLKLASVYMVSALASAEVVSNPNLIFM